MRYDQEITRLQRAYPDWSIDCSVTLDGNTHMYPTREKWSARKGSRTVKASSARDMERKIRRLNARK